MSHARVEEVSDSDPDDMDPSDFDPSNLPAGSIIAPANIPSPSSAPRPQTQAQRPAAPASSPLPPPQREIPRSYKCIYPVYFDKTRSRAEGRKVSKKLAVANPLAREIVDAAQMLGLKVGLEPEKIHPKDWANPGRVRVMIRGEDGRLLNEGVKNKHHLYILIAEYLQAHPTTEQTPFRLHIRGLPMPDKPVPPPAVPRGWKMNTILPIHSCALTGGGVTDNPFKEAMAEMQAAQGGGTPPAISNPNGGEAKKKKEKKKGRA